MPACRMNAKNLAAQVGLALIRPSEDKKLLTSSKTIIQRFPWRIGIAL